MVGTGITVVTPTRGRQLLVKKLLDSLQACEVDGFDLEIIVVDDSEASVEQAIRDDCLRVDARYVRGPREVGRKRNLGVRLASHDIVLFIDSDCLATSNVLRGHYLAHSLGGASVAAVAGPTYFYGPETILGRLAERSMVYEAFQAPAKFTEVLWGTTSNLSVARDVMLDAGGFDEQPLTVVGGEDVDLGIRLHKLGYAISTAPDAAVLHVRSDGLDVLRSMRKLFMYGLADNWLCRRHPDLVIAHLNPVTLTALMCLPVIGPLRRRPPALIAALMIAPIVLTSVAEWFRRSRVRGRGHFIDVLAIPIDWSYDLGVLVGAVRAGRPLEAMSRFNYHPRHMFTRVGHQ